MPVTNVRTGWNAGNLEYRDASGNVIATWDSASRRMVIPSGSRLTVQGGLGYPLATKSADFACGGAESGFTYLITGVDKVATLPATVAGVRYRFLVSAAALSAGTGFSISPNADDKIMGAGLTPADDKDLINTAATDAEGDMIELTGDGVDGWYVTAKLGTWAREG